VVALQAGGHRFVVIDHDAEISADLGDEASTRRAVVVDRQIGDAGLRQHVHAEHAVSRVRRCGSRQYRVRRIRIRLGLAGPGHRFSSAQQVLHRYQGARKERIGRNARTAKLFSNT